MGTALRCDCCGKEALATSSDHGILYVKDRRHGTLHEMTKTLPELVKLLDPKGTSYAPVGTF